MNALCFLPLWCVGVRWRREIDPLHSLFLEFVKDCVRRSWPPPPAQERRWATNESQMMQMKSALAFPPLRRRDAVSCASPVPILCACGVLVSRARAKNRDHARHMRERKKQAVNELEGTLEAGMAVHGQLRQEFLTVTGREFQSEAVALYTAVLEFRESKRGGLREKGDFTPEERWGRHQRRRSFCRVRVLRPPLVCAG